MTENYSVSWSDLFECYREKIENIPDLLGPPVDDLEDDVVEDESDQDCEDQGDSEYKDKVRANWMALSDMRPGAVFDISSDLGSRIIDKNYD